MIDGIPKISVLVICYNQENVISRAIDSLLAQKDYIYEICVSDDCSKDRTWDILQEYSRQYPGLFVLNRNEPNVGIFENIEKTWTMPTGDLVYRLAGDDECASGWFKLVTEFIGSKKIDYKNELFCIYGDYQCIYPSEDTFIFRNNLVTSTDSHVSLALRGLIGNRSAVYSKKVLNRFVNVSKQKSHVAESAQDRQLQLFTQKAYYIPAVGNIYYSRIGVSHNMSKELLDERRGISQYAMQILMENGYIPSSADLNYVKYQSLYRSHSELCMAAFWGTKFCTYFKSRSMKLSYIYKKTKRLLFAIYLRLPHKIKHTWYV